MGRHNRKDEKSKPFVGFRSNFSSFLGEREMHKAVCADCKNACEVPFKPTEGKPVYCRDCYRKHKTY